MSKLRTKYCKKLEVRSTEILNVMKGIVDLKPSWLDKEYLSGKCPFCKTGFFSVDLRISLIDYELKCNEPTFICNDCGIFGDANDFIEYYTDMEINKKPLDFIMDKWRAKAEKSAADNIYNTLPKCFLSVSDNNGNSHSVRADTKTWNDLGKAVQIMHKAGKKVDSITFLDQ